MRVVGDGRHTANRSVGFSQLRLRVIYRIRYARERLAHFFNRLLRRIDATARLVLRRCDVWLGFLDGIVDCLRRHLGHRGYKRRVYLPLERRCCGVGDLRRHRPELLVGVILDARSFDISGQRRNETGREIIGHHVHCINVARLQVCNRRLVIFVCYPVELVVCLQLLNKLISNLELSGCLVGRSCILVYHAYAQVPGCGIGVPKSRDVIPGVKRREHQKGTHHDHCGGCLYQALEIAQEYA